MINVNVKNEGGLTPLYPSHKWTIINIEGLNPPHVNINLTKIPRGTSKYNSSSTDTREITITIVPEGDIAANRIELFSVFPENEEIELNLKTEYHDFKIKGYVSQIEGSNFSKRQVFIVSITCPETYFRDANEIVNILTNIFKNFEFPFAIEEEGKEFSFLQKPKVFIPNGGELPAGLNIKVYFKNKTTGAITLFFEGRQDAFTVRGPGEGFLAGDELEINSIRGNKFITLKRESDKMNYIEGIQPGSTWLELPRQGGYLMYTAETGLDDPDIEIQVTHTNLYGGF